MRLHPASATNARSEIYFSENLIATGMQQRIVKSRLDFTIGHDIEDQYQIVLDEMGFTSYQIPD